MAKQPAEKEKASVWHLEPNNFIIRQAEALAVTVVTIAQICLCWLFWADKNPAI